MRRIFPAILLLIVLAAGCSTPTDPAATDPSGLEGPTWILTKMISNDAVTIDIWPHHLTLTFADSGSVIARGPTNRISGGFRATASGELDVDRLVTTAVYGPGTHLESQVGEALRFAHSFEIRGSTLNVYFGSRGVLEFVSGK